MDVQSVLCPTTVGGTVVGLHRMAYREWGRRDARAVICVHGLARTGRDFDVLARHLSLSGGRRVACPDIAGRGLSQWLQVPAPDHGYNYPQYLVDVLALLARLDVREVDWVGTSMGGLIGMMLAALPDSPVRRLVLNDIGPFVEGAFLDYLAGYIGTDPDFADLAELEAYLRRTYVGFGELDDGTWRHLATTGARRKANGRLGLAYDPAIGDALSPPMADLDLWALWSQVRCPVLVLRGETSPALLPAVAERMTTTGPQATLVTVPGCGHAPSLTVAPQIDLVDGWLATGQLP